MQAAIAGMTIWLQHWYWYPYYTALSLTFTPTVLMGFNKDLKIPSDFGMQCNVCVCIVRIAAVAISLRHNVSLGTMCWLR